jgi:hypothetical protein
MRLPRSISRRGLRTALYFDVHTLRGYCDAYAGDRRAS